VRADRAAAGRIRVAVGVDGDDQPVDLIAGEPGHSRDPRPPVHEDRLCSHKPGDLPVVGRRVDHRHVTGRSTPPSHAIDSDRLNNAQDREHSKPLITPVRARGRTPTRSAGWGTVRRELLDRLLIFGSGQLRSVLTEYVDRYNVHRPHRSLEQAPPLGPARVPAAVTGRRVRRRDGLIHQYEQAA